MPRRIVAGGVEPLQAIQIDASVATTSPHFRSRKRVPMSSSPSVWLVGYQPFKGCSIYEIQPEPSTMLRGYSPRIQPLKIPRRSRSAAVGVVPTYCSGRNTSKPCLCWRKSNRMWAERRSWWPQPLLLLPVQNQAW